MASLFTNQQLPTTSEQAIREFNEKYLAVVSAAPAPTWADRFVTSIGAPRATFPLSAFAAKFRETKEMSSRFKSFQEESFDLKVVEFDEGFEAPMIDLSTNAFAYRNWSKAPERLHLAKQRHISKTLATLLETGSSALSPWDGIAFFAATTHKANPFDPNAGTWGNLQAGALDVVSITNIQAEATSMRAGVKDANGDKLLVDPDELWVPTEKFQGVSDLLNTDRLANGASNPIKGRFTVVEVPDLTDVNDWYLVDSKLLASGFDPMIMADYMPSENLGLRAWDESSDFYKDTSRIKVSQHIWTGSALVFPHGIRKITGA